MGAAESVSQAGGLPAQALKSGFPGSCSMLTRDTCGDRDVLRAPRQPRCAGPLRSWEAVAPRGSGWREHVPPARTETRRELPPGVTSQHTLAPRDPGSASPAQGCPRPCSFSECG